MRVHTFLFLLFGYPFSISGATPCKKDACFNAIASGTRGAPNLASRRADCSSLLRRVVEDDKTLTILRSTTIVPSTITISTQSDGSSTPINRRQDEVKNEIKEQVTIPPDPSNIPSILPRDQFIVSGVRPSYASACRNVQSYAVACICLGIRAATYQAEKTVISTQTISIPATTTVGFDFVAYLKTEGQEFCTSFNSYTAPQVTSTTVDERIEATIVRQTLTSTISILAATVTVTSTSEMPGPVWRRKRAAVPTPSAIIGLDSAVIASVCSLVAMGTSLSVTTTTGFTTTTTQLTTETLVVSLTSTSNRLTTITTYSPDITQIAGSLAGAPSDVPSDQTFTVNLPFSIGIFDTYSTKVCLTLEGLLQIGCERGAQLAPYYPIGDGLSIRKGTIQGIDYQVRTVSNQPQIRFRYYVSSFFDPMSFFNYTATFYQNAPGVVLLDYYSMTNNGGDCVVLNDQSNPPAPSNKSVQIEFPVLVPNKFFRIDTKAGTYTEGVTPRK